MTQSLRKYRVPAIITAAAVTAFAVGGFAVAKMHDPLIDKLKREFPESDIKSVDCSDGPAGLCEVIAGKNVFYATKDGRFAVVGSVLDLKAKKDITDLRLRDLAAMDQGRARIGGDAPANAGGAPGAPAAAAQPGARIEVNLPKENAIVHNPGAALKMTVFTDLNCSFCRRLHDQLKDIKDIEVTEYPVAILAADSLDKAKLALCADDRPAAVDAVYRGGELKTSGDCAAAERAVKANTDFFHAKGIQGTPLIIRSDGLSNEGWLPTEELRSFLRGAR